MTKNTENPSLENRQNTDSSPEDQILHLKRLLVTFEKKLSIQKEKETEFEANQQSLIRQLQILKELSLKYQQELIEKTHQAQTFMHERNDLQDQLRQLEEQHNRERKKFEEEICNQRQQLQHYSLNQTSIPPELFQKQFDELGSRLDSLQNSLTKLFEENDKTPVSLKQNEQNHETKT